MNPSDEPNTATHFSDIDRLTPPIGALSTRFLRWLDHQDHSGTIWSSFDRWLRDTLNEFLGATRVRCLQVSESDHQLRSLTDNLEDAFLVHLGHQGLIDHVIACGRRYVRGASGNGHLIEQLASEWASGIEDAAQASGFGKAPDWLIPIREDNQTSALVVVGVLPDESRTDLATLEIIGHLLEVFYRHTAQTEALALAKRTDQASGVLGRRDFMTLAEHVLCEAIADGEPVVVMALSVEGVRRLDDEGEWTLRDWLMRQIGTTMRQKLRTDDLVGRFSDDRFVAVLRRLDVCLGRLIAGKVLDAVDTRLCKQPVVHQAVTLRCGLAEANSHEIDAVLIRAFDALNQARNDNTVIEVAPSPVHMASEIHSRCGNED